MGLSVAMAQKQKHDWVRALVMPKKTKKESSTTQCKRKPSSCEGQPEPNQPCTDEKSEETIEEGDSGNSVVLDEESIDDPPEAGYFVI